MSAAAKQFERPRLQYVDFRPVGKVVRLEDPYGRRVDHLIFRVAIEGLERSIPKDPNPRDQNINTNVAKAIARTAADPRDTWFHIANRGLLCVGKTVQELAGLVRVHIPREPEVEYGLADGATTYEVLMSQLAKEVEVAGVVGAKFVTVEVIANIPDESGVPRALAVNQLVSSRNTSVQVREVSLQDHKGEYDFIKDALLGTPYNDKIIYRENANGVVDVRDVVTLMLLVNPEIVPTEKNGNVRICHGPNIYGQTNALRMFGNNKDSCAKFATILPSMLEMHDHIGASLARLYNSGYKKQVKAGGLKSIFDEKTPYHTVVTPFTEEKAEYYPAKSVWFSCFGALRQLIEERRGRFAWIVPVEEVAAVFDRVAHRMVCKARECLEETKTDADKLGRMYSLWEHMFSIMERHLIEEGLKKVPVARTSPIET